jgi:gamma-glutamyltranspeptidase/glutathione hydrolase
MTTAAPTAGVAAANRLAAEAGAEILARGGNAVDAALAAAAAMTVTSPHMCGLGGDLFALVAAPGAAPVALNASGRAGSGADASALRAEGHASIPIRGDVRAVTVPGCADGLTALAQRFGRLALGASLAPAIALARDGFPVSLTLAASSAALAPPVRAQAFGAPGALVAGERLTAPSVAAALRALGEEGRTGFYEGAAGEALRAIGAGLFTAGDLRAPQADWVTPLALEAFGATLWTAPPNSQGYLVLAGAWIADAVGVPADPAGQEWPSGLIEAARQAAFDRPELLHEHADGPGLIAPARLSGRAAAIRDRAGAGLSDIYAGGDTTYLCASDADGMGVSLILSNCADFGTHLLLPGTGIFLHNRGVGFSLRAGHPAEYGPGRRPPHTLSPLVVTDPEGALRLLLGSQGGDAQPQILLQLLARTLIGGDDPTAALAAPRWSLFREPSTGFNTWDGLEPPSVLIEHDAPGAWAAGVRARGYDVRVAPLGAQDFGHAQMIAVGPDGTLRGAADPRSGDGAFVAAG